MNLVSEALELLVYKAMENNHPEHLALGFLRYEALRKIKPNDFSNLHVRNLKGENFDGMIDGLITKHPTAQEK